MPRYVVGIAGRAGSGKSLFGAIIASELLNMGYDVGIDAFATPIKQQARDLLGYVGDKQAPHMRWALQTIGERMAGPDGMGLLDRVKRFWTSYTGILVVTDVRRHHEAQWVADNGMLFVLYGRETPLDPRDAIHATEQVEAALKGIDARGRMLAVNNGGNVLDLAREAHNAALLFTAWLNESQAPK